MVGETHIHDITIAARRLRKTRLLRQQKEHATGVHANDLPVFLVNPTRFPELTEDPEPERDFRTKLAQLYAQSATALAPHVDAVRAQLIALRARLYDLPGLWQQQSVREQITTLVLAAFLAPLALLSTLDRPQQPLKNAGAIAPEPPPVFDLNQRLSFAQSLRDRLLSNAITLSMQTPTPALAPLPTLTPLPLDRNAGQISAEAEQSETPSPIADHNHEASGMTIPQIAADDDATWRFPFDSQPYVAVDLPRSPDGSFRAEFAMSNIMSNRSYRASVAENENEDAAAAAAAKVKQNKPTKRKKVVAQKRRPPQGNQITAVATPQPAGVPGEPNLPPPPILFFLGAPPPQSAQPVQAPPSAAPAATKAPPPAPPPANKPWVPNSLSDVFKDAY